MKRATYLAVGEKKPRRKGDKRAKNGQRHEIKYGQIGLVGRIETGLKTHLKLQYVYVRYNIS